MEWTGLAIPFQTSRIWQIARGDKDNHENGKNLENTP
jgi:hypothetical protein